MYAEEERLSLPEELLLIAVDPYTGLLRAQGRVQHGIAGAILSKLLAEGRVWPLRGGRVYVREEKPSGDPLLDQLIKELAEQRRSDGSPRGRDAQRWLREIGLRATTPYMERLTARGVLAVVEQPGGRGPFRDIRYPLLMPEIASIAFGRVDQAVRSPLPPDPRGVLLTALATAVRLDRDFYPHRADTALRMRMEQFMSAYPVARMVRDLVLLDEAQTMRPAGW